MLPRLDSRFVDYYNENLANRPGTHQVPLKEVRSNPGAFARAWALNGGSAPDPNVRDWRVPVAESSKPITVRAYYPDTSKWGLGPYPVHINFHGGGWVFGDLGSDAAICLRLRERVPIVIIDVEYRLCPEARFGLNAQDAWSALKWTRENAEKLDINPLSTSIGGISAGAHLACILQHRARDEGISLRLLVASVPPLADHHTYRVPEDSPWPSFTEFSKVPLLDWERMTYFQKHVFPDEGMAELQKMVPEWWISPLKAPNWTNLCSTFIATAECDMLRDEGEAYAKRLVEGGNMVTMRRYLKVPHSFMHMHSVLPQARQYEDDVISALINAHGIKRE